MDRKEYYPVIFDDPSDNANKKEEDTDFIVPSFCHIEETASKPSVDPTPFSMLDTPPACYQLERPLIVPQPAIGTSPEMTVTQDKKSSRKVNAYDVAQELMAAVPMLLVDECLYAFDGQVYKPMTIEIMKRAIVEHCRWYIQAVGSPLLIRQVYEFLRAEPRLVRKGLRESTRFVAFRNGLLDLETGRLGPFDPQHFVTCKVEANFLPDNVGHSPAFDAFLSSVSGRDALLIQRIWEVIGYTLMPDTSAKVFFLAQGVPNSGKSALGEFIASCFDDDAVTSMDFNALGQQFGVAELLGKRLSLHMDLPGNVWDSRAIGQLKSLTGNDLISADVKYQPRIKFRNTAKFLFGTNHTVSIAGKDPAFFQRLVVLPFRYSVPKEKQDKFIQEHFQQEKDAIVSQAVYAYLRLRQRNYHFSGDFRVNEVVTSGQNINGGQAVTEFFASCCGVEEEALTFLEDLYRSFSHRYPGLLDPGAFSNRLFSHIESLFPGRVRKTRKRHQLGGNPVSAFEGLRLLDTGGEDNG